MFLIRHYLRYFNIAYNLVSCHNYIVINIKNNREGAISTFHIHYSNLNEIPKLFYFDLTPLRQKIRQGFESYFLEVKAGFQTFHNTCVRLSFCPTCRPID